MATHEEVWDDSELVNSWNEALAEYKKYHSLAARGEKVDVVLDKAERGETEEPLLKPAEPTALPNSDSAPAKGPDVTAGAQQHAPAQPSAAHLPIPQALVDCAQDEGLKNLMMSWYYAGYYTGLYEGQQKAYATMKQGG